MLRAVLSTALALAVLAGGLGPASAGPAAPVLATDLDNGLRVLLLEDRRSPIVSFQVWYRVGARNEARGVTGVAHFLEHMMFKGTPAHPRGEFARLVVQNGGHDNAATTMDWTSYYVDIAADRVDLVIELEADRMRNLVIDPREVDSEREVVLEERRTRTEDDPGSYLGEEVNAVAYKAHPYGQPVIGWVEDVRKITAEQIRAFYRTYYVPNNAIVVAVGDFKAPELLAKIKARFGAIPRGAAPPPVLAVEPPQNGERRVTVKKQAQLPIVYLAWHVPDHGSPDAIPLEVLSTIVSGGRASRLFKRLVYERQIALDAGGDYSYLALDPPLFWFYATVMPAQSPETVEQALLAEMDRLGREPVTDEELQRAKNQTEAAFVFAEDSVHSRASTLARFELIGGWALAGDFVQRVRAVTAADVQRVARAWFLPDRKTAGVLLPLK
ncbi:MAG: insulinase family protein [Candidatus Rokubacteria bacterium]|nr:insulinase family protein [Candidatus Rokubacteria bacterium]MBI3826134.1 insulinase family protein [Candidatus Rokubacteria bacterium]